MGSNMCCHRVEKDGYERSVPIDSDLVNSEE
jgi:hypothetical protein